MVSNTEHGESISIREIVELTGQVKGLLALAEKHDKVLYGNGDVGLIRKNDELKQQLLEIREEISNLKSRVVYPLIVTVVLGSGSFMWGLVTHTIQIVKP